MGRRDALERNGRTNRISLGAAHSDEMGELDARARHDLHLIECVRVGRLLPEPRTLAHYSPATIWRP